MHCTVFPPVQQRQIGLVSCISFQAALAALALIVNARLKTRVRKSRPNITVGPGPWFCDSSIRRNRRLKRLILRCCCVNDTRETLGQNTNPVSTCCRNRGSGSAPEQAVKLGQDVAVSFFLYVCLCSYACPSFRTLLTFQMGKASGFLSCLFMEWTGTAGFEGGYRFPGTCSTLRVPTSCANNSPGLTSLSVGCCCTYKSLL